jgi:hypothetical protein
MAIQKSSVTGTFTADGDSDVLECTTGGVLGIDLQRTAGTQTVALQTSLDGTNFAQFYDANGVAVTVGMSASQPHRRFELLAKGGQQFKLVGSSASSANIIYDMKLVERPV